MSSPSKPRSTKSKAFLSDIHGNLQALDAILEELQARGIEEIYVAGDLLLGGPDPLGVWRRLKEVGAVCCRGLSDTALVTIDTKTVKAIDEEQKRRLKSFEKTRQQVGDLVIEQLRRLPETIRIPLNPSTEALLVHGSPLDPRTEFSHDMTDDEMLELLANDPADIVVCGASHIPFQRKVHYATIINVGSVGQSPERDVAHYTIIEPAELEIEQSWVELNKER